VRGENEDQRKIGMGNRGVTTPWLEVQGANQKEMNKKFSKLRKMHCYKNFKSQFFVGFFASFVTIQCCHIRIFQ
jgi:hypothetical protein